MSSGGIFRFAYSLFACGAISLAIGCGGSSDSGPSFVAEGETNEVAAGSMVDIAIMDGALAGFDLEGASFADNSAVDVVVMTAPATNVDTLDEDGADFDSAGPTVLVTAKLKGTDQKAIVDGMLTMQLPINLAALQSIADANSETVDSDFVMRRVLIKVTEEDGSERVVVPAATGHVLTGDTPTVRFSVADFSKFHAACLRSAQSFNLSTSNAEVDQAIAAFNQDPINGALMKTELDAARALHRQNPRYKFWRALELMVREAESDATASSANVPFASAKEILDNAGATDMNTGGSVSTAIQRESTNNPVVVFPENQAGDSTLPTAGNISGRVFEYQRNTIGELALESLRLLESLPSDFEESYQTPEGETINFDNTEILLLRSAIHGYLFGQHFMAAYNFDQVNFADLINKSSGDNFSINTDILDAHPELGTFRAGFQTSLASAVAHLRKGDALYRDGWNRLKSAATMAQPDYRTNHLFALNPDDSQLTQSLMDETEYRGYADKALSSIDTGAFTEDFGMSSAELAITSFNLHPLLKTGVNLRTYFPMIIEDNDEFTFQLGAGYDHTFGGIFPTMTREQVNTIITPTLVTLPTASITVDGSASDWPAGSLIGDRLSIGAVDTSFFGNGGIDLDETTTTKFYAARFGTTLFFRIDFVGDISGTAMEIESNTEFNVKFINQSNGIEGSFSKDLFGLSFSSGEEFGLPLGIVIGDQVRVGKVLEFSIDLAQMESGTDFASVVGDNIEVDIERVGISNIDGNVRDSGSGSFNFTFKR